MTNDEYSPDEVCPGDASFEIESPFEELIDWFLNLEDLTACLIAKRTTPFANIIFYLQDHWQRSPYEQKFLGDRRARFFGRYQLRRDKSISFEGELKHVNYLVPAVIFSADELHASSVPLAGALSENALIDRISSLLNSWKEVLDNAAMHSSMDSITWDLQSLLSKELLFRQAVDWQDSQWLIRLNRAIQPFAERVLEAEVLDTLEKCCVVPEVVDGEEKVPSPNIDGIPKSEPLTENDVDLLEAMLQMGLNESNIGTREMIIKQAEWTSEGKRAFDRLKSYKLVEAKKGVGFYLTKKGIQRAMDICNPNPQKRGP